MVQKERPKGSSIGHTWEEAERMRFPPEEIAASDARVAEIGKEIRARMAGCCAYPAIFTCESGKEVSVVFPDLDVATSGSDEPQALQAAKKLPECVLQGLAEDGESFPAPTPLGEITVEQNERAILVETGSWNRTTILEPRNKEEAAITESLVGVLQRDYDDKEVHEEIAGNLLRFQSSLSVEEIENNFDQVFYTKQQSEIK